MERAGALLKVTAASRRSPFVYHWKEFSKVMVLA
jgi:hypothetical protein